MIPPMLLEKATVSIGFDIVLENVLRRPGKVLSLSGWEWSISSAMIALVLLEKATVRVRSDIIFENTLLEPVSNRTSHLGKT
jgi:hypothetical protein